MKIDRGEIAHYQPGIDHAAELLAGLAMRIVEHGDSNDDVRSIARLTVNELLSALVGVRLLNADEVFDELPNAVATYASENGYPFDPAVATGYNDMPAVHNSENGE